MMQLSVIVPVILLFASPLYGKKYDTYNQYYDPRQNYYDMAEKYRRYDHYQPPTSPFHQKMHTFIADFGPTPPPHDQVAKMARYIVHNADWGAISTHSSSPAIRGFPFANIVSISDGTSTNSSGVPYMYITPLELSTRDLEIDSRCSLALSLAETDYCKQQNIDPEDPRCARVILTGKVKRVKTHTSEIDYAENALFSRHPAMRSWPRSHGFYFAKLKIEQILVLDYYGGPKIVPKPEYFNPGDVRFRI
ncbi:Uncharacterized protein GBIM_12737 [Gryllus bimaculatus]|nr:Uncharacterized protein GBIM_12737 [Gryllus bimaculatus]